MAFSTNKAESVTTRALLLWTLAAPCLMGGMMLVRYFVIHIS